MESKIKLGKVNNFDGLVGKIVTENEEYLFLDKDVENDVQNGSLVLFRNEEIGSQKRAFFVKEYDESNENDRHLIK